MSDVENFTPFLVVQALGMAGKQGLTHEFLEVNLEVIRRFYKKEKNNQEIYRDLEAAGSQADSEMVPALSRESGCHLADEKGKVLTASWALPSNLMAISTIQSTRYYDGVT